VHAHELEHRSHRLRHATQLQIAALGIQLPEGGNERPQSGAVDEAQTRQIDHQLRMGVDHRRHVALELFRVARIEVLHRHRQDGHVTALM
jgi:hypothetical protein